MKNFLNFNRFIFTFRRLFIEKGIALFGILIAVLFLEFLLFRSSDSLTYNNIRPIIYYFGLVVLVFTSMFLVANEFESSTKSVTFLLLPASVFEKWLAQILLGLCIIVALYIMFFYVIDASTVYFIKNKITNKEMPYYAGISVKKLDIKPLLFPTIVLSIKIGFIVQMGVLLFKRRTFVKTILSFIGIYLAILFINNLMLKLMIGKQANDSLFSNIPFNSATIGGKKIVLYSFEWYDYAWLVTILALLLVIPYFNLKEKEV